MRLIKRGYEDSYHDTILYREKVNSQRNQRRLQLLIERRTSGKLLEVGCGEAGFLRLAEDHFDVEGIDISRQVVERIRPHFGERVRVMNIEMRSLPRSQYDVIVVFNILEHLRQPQRAVQKLYQALRTGGLMIGSVPNNYGLLGSLVTRLGNYFDRTHISTFSPQTWQRIFHLAGFQSLQLFGETTLGRNRCFYQTSRLWPHVSFNLMFICRKGPD